MRHVCPSVMLLFAYEIFICSSFCRYMCFWQAATIFDSNPWLKRRAYPIHIHVVFKSSRNSAYPVNFLRNIAISNVQTSHVFLCDVDFIPMPKLHEKLVKQLFSALGTYPGQVCILDLVLVVLFSHAKGV